MSRDINSSKRNRESCEDDFSQFDDAANRVSDQEDLSSRPSKFVRTNIDESQDSPSSLSPSLEASRDSTVHSPYPYFHYEDFSQVQDNDPMMPLTSAGKVPNFPAKMHAILSRQDLQDVVSWMPHGRSWRVHKPREFEIRVIPVYFEHVKFSSFIRQANGWGFHRITVDSRDRNSYYHPLFLRGLPHLCKPMKRPGTAKKQIVDPQHEPDLYEISKTRPVPDGALDDSILLPFTMTGGPKARVPILSLGMFSNTLTSSSSAASSCATPSCGNSSPASHCLIPTVEEKTRSQFCNNESGHRDKIQTAAESTSSLSDQLKLSYVSSSNSSIDTSAHQLWPSLVNQHESGHVRTHLPDPVSITSNISSFNAFDAGFHAALQQQITAQRQFSNFDTASLLQSLAPVLYENGQWPALFQK
jgi:HSF-type DNA-binding